MHKVKRSAHRPRDLVPDVSVYDGRMLRGRIVFLGCGFRAEDAEGRSLGIFETRSDAQDAISEAGRR